MHKQRGIDDWLGLLATYRLHAGVGGLDKELQWLQ